MKRACALHSAAWRLRRESNPYHPVRSRVLCPLSYGDMATTAGVEPASPASEAGARPSSCAVVALSAGVEPARSGVEARRSSCRAARAWRREPESNRPQRRLQRRAFPEGSRRAERAAGIEPASTGWKPIVLPLNDARMRSRRRESNTAAAGTGRGARLERTGVELSRGIEPRSRLYQSRALPLCYESDGARGESRTRSSALRVRRRSTSASRAWWRRGESNPDLLLARQPCSRCHYVPMVTLA